MHLFFTVIFTSLYFLSFCQNARQEQIQIDSLKKIINQSKNDSLKVIAYMEWDDLIYLNDPLLDLTLNEKIKLICSKQVEKNPNSVFYKTQLSYAFNNLGNLLEYKGNYSLALEYHQKSLALANAVKDEMRIASSYNNIGNLYKRLQLHDKALINYNKSLALRKKMKDVKNQAIVLNNIGLVYLAHSDFKKAEFYLRECLKFNIPTSNNLAYLNLGMIRRDQNQLDSSLLYFQKSYTIDSTIQNKKGMVVTLNRWGHACIMKGQELDKMNSTIKAKLYHSKGLILILKALKLAEELNHFTEALESHSILWNIYKINNQTDKAFYHLEKYAVLNEKLNVTQGQEQILQKEFKHQINIKNVKDSLKRIEVKKINDEKFKAQEIKLKNEKQQKYFLYFGLFILVIFGLFIFNRFQITKRQNLIIEKQKAEVELAHITLEEKNNEIVDSINYAKRIQAAIFPSTNALNETSDENFILYRPKDIVAGDFYWIEKIISDNNKLVTLLAVADCTGHGVPGALVSVVCHNALNKALHEHQLIRPDLILNKTREIIIKEFEKGISEKQDSIKDGMDIALCSIEGDQLKFSGAHNPLWIIRNNKLIEFKGDKQPIGKYDNSQDFKLNEFKLEKGDSLFIFTDGFQDQFGGVHENNGKPSGKKYKAAKLKELLLSINHYPLKKQLDLINEAFDNWKGNLEQVDDVCIIGLRI